MLHPAAYVGRAVPELLAGLSLVGPEDLHPAEEGQVDLHSTLAGADSVTCRPATLLLSTRPEADLPPDHPEVDLPGVMLEEYLGGGGQGWVYVGRVLATGRLLAVKVLRTDVGGAAATALREAALCARVRHRNILRVFRSQPAGQFNVILMELVQGQELTADNLPAGERRGCFGQLADALRRLHERRIVHCDVKPANVILRQSDHSPVLVDFGVAQDLANLRLPEGISGTPYFLAPEVFRDNVPHPAWDAYALGVTASVLLVGRIPGPASLPALRVAKTSGAFDDKLRHTLADSPDPELGAWAADLIDRRQERRLTALEAARSWAASRGAAPPLAVEN